MTHVLVTGAAGHIGRHVVDDLPRHGYRVTATDRKPLGDPRPERGLTRDLRDRELVREALRGVEALVHLAAIPHPDPEDPAGRFTANCHTAYLALDEAGRAGVRRIMAASSIGALGLAWSAHPRSPGRVPVDESHATLAEDPYGLSKLVPEPVAEGTHRRWGTDTVCLRFPFTGTGARLTRQLAAVHAEPGRHASDLWGRPDTRDAAADVRAADAVTEDPRRRGFRGAPPPRKEHEMAQSPGTTRRTFLTRTAAGALGAGALATAGGRAAATAPDSPAARLAPSPDVHIFYYPWYGSPEVSGSWRHWPQGGLTPPDRIGSDFYPVAGAYDSGDRAVVDRHLGWLAQARTGVLVTSWWGRGGYEDQRVQPLLDAAAARGLEVAWHIEPYAGRTARSVVDDIGYLIQRYGGHPAFHRDAAHGSRGAYYVFESLRIADWTPLDQVADRAIVLAQTTDVSKVAHFGGMYTYDAIAAGDDPQWGGPAAYCRDHGMVWAPSIGPGYIDDRAVPGNTTPTLERADGATYDLEWNTALSQANGGPPTWVSITSFNEWHEGSQIEPATATPPTALSYRTYSGAYGRTGRAAETAYLDRTAYWVGRFEAAVRRR